MGKINSKKAITRKKKEYFKMLKLDQKTKKTDEINQISKYNNKLGSDFFYNLNNEEQLGLKNKTTKLNSQTSITPNTGYKNLFWCVKYKDIISAEILLNNKISPNLVNKQKLTPLFYAINNNDKEMVELLLKNNANPNWYKKQIPSLNYAIKHQKWGIVKLLLKNNANPNLLDRKKYPPLHYALEYGDIEIFTLLLDYGADINMQYGAKKNTILHYAIEKEDYAMINSLIEYGAKFNLSNKEMPPLHYAIQYEDRKSIEVLLIAGADPNLLDNKKCPPLHYCIQRGDLKSADLLLDYNANLNLIYGFKKTTLLHQSIGMHQNTMIEFLINKGANKEIEDHYSNTSLQLAKIVLNKTAISLLDRAKVSSKASYTKKRKFTAQIEESKNEELFTHDLSTTTRHQAKKQKSNKQNNLEDQKFEAEFHL